ALQVLRQFVVGAAQRLQDRDAARLAPLRALAQMSERRRELHEVEREPDAGAGEQEQADHAISSSNAGSAVRPVSHTGAPSSWPRSWRNTRIRPMSVDEPALNRPRVRRAPSNSVVARAT